MEIHLIQENQLKWILIIIYRYKLFYGDNKTEDIFLNTLFILWIEYSSFVKSKLMRIEFPI